MEGEHGMEEEETGRQLLDGKGLRPGTQMLATHSYKKNPNGPVGNELDLMEGDTVSCKCSRTCGGLCVDQSNCSAHLVNLSS